MDAEELIRLVADISAFSDFRSAFRKPFCNLARRLKLLAPMFEEVRDGRDKVPDEAAEQLRVLKDALVGARELLRFGSEGSKICLVCPCLKFSHLWPVSLPCSSILAAILFWNWF